MKRNWIFRKDAAHVASVNTPDVSQGNETLLRSLARFPLIAAPSSIVIN